MQMKRNDRQKRTSYLDAFAAEAPECCSPVMALLKGARAEAMDDAAVKFSGHLDRMATHVVNEGLSATEIVELMRQESEHLGRVGRGAAL